MLTTALLSLLGSTVALALPQPLDQRASSTPCQPNALLPQYGTFGGITDEIHYWGLDAQFQLVAPEEAVTPSFNATFEVCSALGTATNSDPNLESPSFGRIVLTPSIGGDHTCLTIINPSDAGSGNPLFAKASECTDDVTPSADQIWVYGYLDDYGAMFWVGDSSTVGHEDGYGFLEEYAFPNTLFTDSNGRIEIVRRTDPPAGTIVADFEFYTPNSD